MASTLTNLLYHCIWSTKDRLPLFTEFIETDVWKIIGGVATRNDITVIQVGGFDDHIHALFRIPKTMTVSEAMKRVKGGSSKQINKEGLLGAKLQWQDGYAAFTVSKSNQQAVLSYIHGQRKHHQRMTFKEEFIQFIERHEIEYDSKYLWT